MARLLLVLASTLAVCDAFAFVAPAKAPVAAVAARSAMPLQPLRTVDVEMMAAKKAVKKPLKKKPVPKKKPVKKARRARRTSHAPSSQIA